MKIDPLKNPIWNVSAAILMLWLPLIIYLKHHAYPMVSPEAVLCLVLTAAAGLFWGLLMTVGRTPVRLAVTVFLAVLIVDIQTDWISGWALRLLLNVLFFSTLFWFMRKRLSQIMVLLAGVMILGTLVTPSREQVRIAGPSLDEGVTRPDLPFILHIVLDEQIGIEGIPREFDPDRAVADQVRDTYLDLGFRVFGRAYASYWWTIMSIPNQLNFTRSDNPTEYLPYPIKRGDMLEKNAWFDRLTDQGYRLHIIQPDFLVYDRNVHSQETEPTESSVTFASESIHALAQAEMPRNDKTRFILGSYMRLSFFLSKMRGLYGDLRRSGFGQAVGLSPWDLSGQHLSTLSSLKAVLDLENDLQYAEPGRAYFVHLLLPHYPYALERDCGIREGWLNPQDDSESVWRMDAPTRAMRYPKYLDQVICSTNLMQKIMEDLSGNPWWDDAIVIVQGDHGSRQCVVRPSVAKQGEISGQDLMDAYSALFAIKMPGLAAEYDSRQLPLGHLFKRLMRDGVDPGDPELESRPRVLLFDAEETQVEVDLPFFDDGIPQEDSPSSH
jgi:hypothetical protein